MSCYLRDISLCLMNQNILNLNIMHFPSINLLSVTTSIYKKHNFEKKSYSASNSQVSQVTLFELVLQDFLLGLLWVIFGPLWVSFGPLLGSLKPKALQMGSNSFASLRESRARIGRAFYFLSSLY